jgi:hypothetical protein
MTRTLLCALLLVVGLALPWQFFILGCVVYAFWYEGVELIVLGFLLDAYVGAAMPWIMFPAIYTFALSGILLSVWGFKPLLFIDGNASTT